jgi:predicted HicB family RNase H-like nuclease
MRNRKFKQVACYLTPELHVRVKKMAKRQHISVAHLIRTALTQYMFRHGLLHDK